MSRLWSREGKVNFLVNSPRPRASFLGEKAKRTEEKSFLDAIAASESEMARRKAFKELSRDAEEEVAIQMRLHEIKCP